MSKQQFTTALEAELTAAGPARFSASQYSGLRANSLMIDVTMVPASGKEWNVEDLREIYLSVNFRRSNADALQLMDSVLVYDAVSFGDFNAGVSMSLANQLKPKTDQVRFSTVIPFGSFSVQLDESVEVLLANKPTNLANYTKIVFSFRWAFVADISSRVFGYKSFKSAGGEQTYRDVLNFFILPGAGVDVAQKSATIRDYTGSQQVSLADSIAYANAAGRFEWFTNFGVLYTDPTGFSQDVTLSLEAGFPVLMQQEFYSLSKNLEQDSQMLRDKEAVLQGIYVTRPEKYQVLKSRGDVPGSFAPAGS